MTAWTDQRTGAHQNVGNALAVVDNLLSYVKDSQGKPSKKERALFAAAVVFIYGIWENFVEQLAIELVQHVSEKIAPEKVPDQVRQVLEKKSAWQLSVSPGWRSLWIAQVTVQAVGDDGERFGMNTAKAGQVKNLLMQAGVTDPFKTITAKIIPDHLPEASKNVEAAIEHLVDLRGEIVHTGKVPTALRKNHVHAWRQFVEDAADKIDDSCRAQCKQLVR
jgi:hypothetical protein